MNDSTQYLVLGLINLVAAIAFASKVNPYRNDDGHLSMAWPFLAIAVLCGGSAVLCAVMLLTT